MSKTKSLPYKNYAKHIVDIQKMPILFLLLERNTLY
jgi:hypothetical protein